MRLDRDEGKDEGKDDVEAELWSSAIQERERRKYDVLPLGRFLHSAHPAPAGHVKCSNEYRKISYHNGIIRVRLDLKTFKEYNI
jgi:hypothetical protein